MADEPTTGEGKRRTLWAGVRESYQRVPAGGRTLILVVGAALVVGLLALVVTASTAEQWRAVAKDLAPEDLEAAVKALEDKKIAHELGDESSILVPPEAIHEARLALAVNAMPSGKSVGFELFDTSAMGRSAFTEKVNLHRALEGELARTIRYIDGIERVRVHLVTPERRVFKELDVRPSASVILQLAPGAEITRDKAQAIRQLVSGAVERLDPGQVAIVDQRGRMLTRPDDEGLGSGDAFERQREQERALEERVVRLLEPMVGVDKVMVRVALDMDLSRVVETREDFDPNQQVVRSEREQLDRTDTGSPLPSGPPGTASNLPGGQTGARGATGGAAGHEKSDTIRNYEVDKVTTQKENPLPRVRKLSVAVLVDEASELKDGVPVPRARTPEELAQLSRLVSRAVGLDPGRGDQIEVTSAPFASIEGLEPIAEVAPETGAPVGTTPAPETPLWEQPLVWVIAGGALLLVLALVVALRVSARRRSRTEALALATSAPSAPPEVPDAGSEVHAAERRARIAELRERALTLGNEDLHRLAAAFERWFAMDETSDATARVTRSGGREAA